ncbi:MAG: AMP-binding protein [Clostridia bacterium]|nr:AMP-binding protein [Clostridia bacterium]
MKDYEMMHGDFRINVPEYFNFASDVVDKWAREKDKTALIYVDDRLRDKHFSFSYISERSDAVGSLLQSHGVIKGDKVFISLPRIPEWWELMMGIQKAGAVAVPGTVQLTAKDMAYRIKASGAKVAITNEANAAKIEEIRDECPDLQVMIIVDEEREDWVNYREAIQDYPGDFDAVKTRSQDLAVIYFTSGTTGYPKMVVHTQASYPLAHTVTGKFWLDLKSSDLHWNIADIGWGKAAWSSLFGPWHMGAAVFVHDFPKRFDPKLTLELMEKYEINTLCAPPTVYRLLVLEKLEKYNFSALRHCVSAGEPLNPETISLWKKHTKLEIYDGYGQTETTILVANFPCMKVKPGSMGKPAPGFYVDVVDEEGNPLPQGVEGDIAIDIRKDRPVGLFKEYLKDADGTKDRFRNGWYFTGDRAYKDEDGYFWFIGRSDDLIISSGYRIGPFEVESALVEHPAVLEAAVVGSPDPVRGEVVKAFIIPVEGFELTEKLADDIKAFVRKQTAPYKYPREIEFVEELPKTVSGKIQRVKLRQLEREKKAAHDILVSAKKEMSL